MLNELASLRRSLVDGRIQAQAWHPWIQTFKKGGALVAELDTDGALSRVSSLTAEHVAGLRNIAPDFHNSFPGINLNCPLLVLSDAGLWNRPDELWSVALTAVVEGSLAYDTGDLRRVERLLNEFPGDEIAPRLAGTGQKVQSTLAVLERLARAKYRPAEFLRELARGLLSSAQKGELSREFALAVLFGKANRKRQKLDDWKVTLIFDVSDVEEFDYRVADPAVAPAWSALLLGYEKAGGVGRLGTSFVCALSGEPDQPVGDKMPNPNLPILGPTYLMSMNADIPCQTRYGRISTAIFPVGKGTAQLLNDAILFATGVTRRNKTWTGVPNGYREKQSDLLLSYLEDEPDSDIPLVGYFAGVEQPESNAAADLATYESRTSEIHSALRLREKVNRDSYIRVIALSKLDLGRKQVLFSGRYSTAAIYQGRDNWIAGCRNIPLIAVPFFAKGKPWEWRSGCQPSPSEVMVSFRKQWLRAGQTSQSVPGVDLARIYGLLLEPDAGAEAAWLIDRYVRLTAPLMIGLGSFLAGIGSLSEPARREALIAAAVYGILLYRQGLRKETYVESREYLIGRFLQFADQLHRLYCKDVRGGNVPAQLIGNAAMAMAIQSPKRALTVLCTRMGVYLAWAERFTGEDAGLVKWTRSELGKISLSLKDLELDTRVSANGKAELLLGYLASSKKSEGKENTNQ